MTEDHLFCHTAPQENPEAKGHITVNPAASGPFSFQSHFRASPPKSPPNSTRFLPQSLPQGFGLLPQPFWRANENESGTGGRDPSDTGLQSLIGNSQYMVHEDADNKVYVFAFESMDQFHAVMEMLD